LPRTPRTDRLDNGVSVLVETDAAIPLVDVDVVLRGGSLHDPVGRDGLTRLLARLTRRGTARHAVVGALGSEALDDAIESLGAALTIDVTTGAVRFHGSVIRRNLEPFFALLCSVLLAPALRPRDLAQVRREALAELVAQHDNDRWLAARVFRRALFRGHPYGRSSSGTPASLSRATLSELRALHDARVRAQDLVVAFAGDVTRDDALRLSERHLAAAPGGAAPTVAIPEPPAPRGVRVVLVDKPERTQTQLFVGTLGARMGEPQFYPLVVANTVFGGTFTARLVSEVRSKRGWSYSAQSRLYADRGRDAWVVYTHPSVQNAAACLRLELDLVRAFVRRGVTASEVAFARSYLTKSHAFERDTAAKRLEPRVEAALFGLPVSFFERYEDHVAKVTAAQASRAVSDRLGGPGGQGRDLVVVVLGPARRLEGPIGAIPGVATLETIAFDQVTSL
jgi:zinc protease